jgi:hypothetical protein
MKLIQYSACQLAIVLLALAPPLLAQDAGTPDADTLADAIPARPYSPYADSAVPTHVFWGETHVHTAVSFDAGAFGVRLLPEDAYRFARGEEVESATAGPVRLARPLDFLAVADHSDNMGFFPALFAGDPEILSNPTGRRWYDMVQEGGRSGVAAALEMIDAFSRGTFPESIFYKPTGAKAKGYRDTWTATMEAAEKYNEPGRFTAFIGYEWTSQVPPGDNLHRVVIYRDGMDRAAQTLPYTTIFGGSTNPEDLWTAMEAYEEKTGGDVLAIAHNGNLSNGIMFPIRNPVSNKRLTPEYAQRRARWEPLYEATQMKGDGEAHPFLSPNDEFADYGTWDKGNLNLSVPKENDMLAGEYARSGLKRGLRLEEQLGTNPFKYGLIGATDSHTGLSTADDDNYFGKTSGMEPSPTRMEHPFAKFGDVAIMGWETLASGYQAIWARENTRAALFDAMERKETYATTGPRIIVRFFGGWDFESNDAATRRPAAVGYRKGVPMGGDLSNAPAGKSPTFLVGALKDPYGANIDRVQIIKGWLDANGNLQEKIYDVAVSDGRTIGADGRASTPVGNTVDVENATFTNTIGDTELITVWADPDFDPKERAFYYVRVLEIPTPRWTAYDAKYFGVEVSDEVEMVHQERAYTSPIWYTP